LPWVHILLFPWSFTQFYLHPLTLYDANGIADSGDILVNGLPPGCSNQYVCGHVYVLIPDGDCDSDCEGRIAASQNAAAPAQNAATMQQGNERLVSPLEPFRSMMRQRYHIPGQPAAPRD